MPILIHSCIRRSLALLLPILLIAPPITAAGPKLSKYPLHVHVLASDDIHKTPRMRPEEAVVCDSIDGVVSSISPNPGGPISVSGISGDPCSLHPEFVVGRLMDIDNDVSFSGAGRADLVSPPTMTQGLSFQYNDCTRVRVPTGFQSLPARWKKPGKTLEVLIPSDEIPANGRPLPPVRCTFSVTMHDFVYLLLRNGSVVQVSQEDYWKKPALRAFLSGRPLTVQERTQQFTVPAHPTK